jgi:hypothetical protein
MTCPKCVRGGTGPHPAGCTPAMRFWRKIKKVAGCWEWQGARHSFGYGQFRVGNGTKRGRMIFAHRFAYEGAWGPIEDGLEVMHTCDNPRCVRPAHLRAGTHAENMQDMIAKGRRKSVSHNRGKTHCVRGHEFTEENTYRRGGWRSCRRCHAVAESARKRRIPA